VTIIGPESFNSPLKVVLRCLYESTTELMSDMSVGCSSGRYVGSGTLLVKL